MSATDERGALVNSYFNTRLLFLARLAARREGVTLVEFIEDALTRAITPMPPWMEGLWVDTGEPDKDAAARIYEVGMKDAELLAPRHRVLFNHIVTELAKQGKKVTRKNFVGFIDFSESGE